MGFTEITVQDTILSSRGGFHSRVMTGSVELSGMASTMRLYVCNSTIWAQKRRLMPSTLVFSSIAEFIAVYLA